MVATAPLSALLRAAAIGFNLRRAVLQTAADYYCQQEKVSFVTSCDLGLLIRHCIVSGSAFLSIAFKFFIASSTILL